MDNVLEEERPDLIVQVRAAMENYFGDDRRRIEHARCVADYARKLLDQIEAAEGIVMTAAYLHDIGIPEAERKHGSSSGKYQEIEGPPVAKSILESLGAEGTFIETVCALVGAHHTPNGIDSPEFKILWDADALVNLRDVLPGKNIEEVSTVLQKSLVTGGGLRLGREIFLGESSPEPYRP